MSGRFRGSDALPFKCMALWETTRVYFDCKGMKEGPTAGTLPPPHTQTHSHARRTRTQGHDGRDSFERERLGRDLGEKKAGGGTGGTVPER